MWTSRTIQTNPNSIEASSEHSYIEHNSTRNPKHDFKILTSPNNKDITINNIQIHFPNSVKFVLI